MFEANETRIPNIEAELEKADALKDRKRVKLLLNNLWWQIKEGLGRLSQEKRMEILALFDRYGDSKHFKKISQTVLHPDPNSVVETLKDVTVVVENDKPKVKYEKRMVRLANGEVVTEEG